MERIFIEDLKNYLGEGVTIMGSVESMRDHGKLLFMTVRDCSGTVQAVYRKPDNAKDLSQESVLRIQAKVKERPDSAKQDAINGELEVEVVDLEILSKADVLPFDVETAELNIDTQLDYRPLTLRRRKDRAVLAVQAEIVSSFRDTLSSNRFVEFQAPKLVGGDAEGGAGVFCVDYFDKDAFLATSPQLYKQILVGVLERVFCVSTVFRAEKHSTTRHLSEYTSLDAEMGFIKDHTDVMKVMEQIMRNMVFAVKENKKVELDILEVEVPLLPEVKFPSYKLKDAQVILKEKYGFECIGEMDLEPEHERKLCQYSREKYKSDFIFISHFPVEKRPFYAYEDEEDYGYTKSFDLLFKGVEISSGGQRKHLYSDICESIKKKGLDPKKFEFYLQAFKYGMSPHGGFGIGLERLTQKFTGLDNAKLATPFPRDLLRIDSRFSKEYE